MKVYCISGMGADFSLYENIIWPDGFEPIALPWLEPSKKENLEEYALRVAEPINLSQPFVLCGISMGGICAQIIAAQLKPAKLILLSTVKGKHEMPWPMRWFSGKLLSRYVPARVFRWMAFMSTPILGLKMSDDHRAFRKMMAQLSPEYYRWALYQIANWQAPKNVMPILHVHGSSDQVFPAYFIKNAVSVAGGSHLMVQQKPAEVSSFIKEFLGS